MNILAVDTTTKVASVSVFNEKDDKYYEDSISNEITHSEKLLPLIDKTLNCANLLLRDIDTYACINGPGSFTGIRIGLSTIKAFSHVYNKDIFAISATEALAFKAYNMNNMKNESYVLSLIDAKNNRVYFEFFKISKTNDDKLSSTSLINISNKLIDETLQDVLNYLENENIQNANIPVIFVGDVITKYTDKISNMLENFSCIFSGTYPTSSDVIHIIENISNKNKYMYNAFTLDAVYARLSQAERIKNEDK